MFSITVLFRYVLRLAAQYSPNAHLLLLYLLCSLPFIYVCSCYISFLAPPEIIREFRFDLQKAQSNWPFIRCPRHRLVFWMEVAAFAASS
jgi:hypothetical protein